MSSEAVVIVRIGYQDPAQMRLTQNDNVVQTLAPDRCDQPFGETVRQRCGWCNRVAPNAHGSQSACDECPIDPIAITDHVTRSSKPLCGYFPGRQHAPETKGSKARRFLSSPQWRQE